MNFPQIKYGTQIMKVSQDDRIYFIKKTAWLHNTLFEALTEINSIFSIEVNDFQFNFLIKSNPAS